jgi:hypothetical protein
MAALPSNGTIGHSHHGGEGHRHPTKRWQAFPRAHWPSILLRQGYGGQGRSALGIAHLPTGTTAAKGLAALPDGGAHFRRARWRAFTRAHWPSILLRQGYGGQGRSALPQHGMFPQRQRRRPESARPTSRKHTFPPGTLAEHPPSPRLRRTRTLGPFRAPSATTRFPRHI